MPGFGTESTKGQAMVTDQASAATRAAEGLAAARPEGQVRIAAALLEVLYARIGAWGEEDAAIPAAVAAGDAFAGAIDAGCPPQFHPGVPAEHAAVLEATRRRLGLDRATAVEVAAETDTRYVRLLRAIGCTVVSSTS